ncbi:plasmid mobilization relaxosome protein MobC [Mesonia sp.]|uniref:plasmid mobilization protein n=1 Tax=Mesonia sp. TaxID=1960830 RepID=UPI000C9920EF|nr:plasmid mobilization relaxosome protein MobC [Mesonia sp.]MAN25697.1 plasmid mobilization relaxosome protein MobC [Mesonia sp.]|tara:strand:- start:1564 stop:1953 length:390 start_codon:yes stop_codon:yes gene_type:complete
MGEKKSNRTRIIGLRLTPDEYRKIEKKCQRSTCRKLSEYVRHSLFEKPIVTTYRNQSADDFMVEMAKLRKELNHLGNNFNQAVKKLHTLQKVTEFKSWLIAYEVEKRTLFNKVDEIKNHIQKMAEKWLQ